MPPIPKSITLTPSIDPIPFEDVSELNYQGRQILDNVVQINTEGGFHSDSTGTWVGGDKFEDAPFTIGTGGELNSPTIDALNTSLEQAESELANLTVDLEDLDDDIIDLDSDLSDLEDDLDDLDTELSDLDDSLGDLALLDTIGDGQIIDNTISGVKIANGTILTPKLVADVITANELAAEAVIARNILAGSIETDHLAARQITTLKIATDAVTANEILGKTITADQIAANTITADEMTVAQLSAISQNVGTLTGGSITGLTITGGLFRTATSGQHIEIQSQNSNQIRFYEGNGYYGQLEIDSDDDDNGFIRLETDIGSAFELTTGKGNNYNAGASMIAGGFQFYCGGTSNIGSAGFGFFDDDQDLFGFSINLSLIHISEPTRPY